MCVCVYACVSMRVHTQAHNFTPCLECDNLPSFSLGQNLQQAAGPPSVSAFTCNWDWDTQRLGYPEVSSGWAQVHISEEHNRLGGLGGVDLPPAPATAITTTSARLPMYPGSPTFGKQIKSNNHERRLALRSAVHRFVSISKSVSLRSQPCPTAETLWHLM